MRAWVCVRVCGCVSVSYLDVDTTSSELKRRHHLHDAPADNSSTAPGPSALLRAILHNYSHCYYSIFHLAFVHHGSCNLAGMFFVVW